MKKQKHLQKYSVDHTMQIVWDRLRQDFNLTGGSYETMAAHLAVGDIPSFRRIDFPSYTRVEPQLYRRCYQLQSLFKRYRFKNDLYATDELHRTTVRKLLDCQVRIASVGEFDSRLFSILQLARKICKQILGKYNQEEHAKSCRFAKRATVGNPFSDAYLDLKMGALTGSREHIQWFKHHILSDSLLKECIKQCSLSGEPVYTECDFLRLTNVPKSFKALRSIMPNTTLGSFYSAGLGDMIQSKLKKAKLDIRYLQQKHRNLAKRYSITRSHVTADLSSASDSISTALLCRILPRDWFTALNFGRLKQFEVDECRYYLHSFMTMGIGFTFPLETLVFYSLIESIRRLMKAPGSVSVYGDDLIYHRKMHSTVTRVFGLLGIILNQDKTFVTEFFRESCGGDYYHGLDVRPFQPESCDASLVTRSKYITYLYKVVNGLKQRWGDDEIPLTLAYLVTTINSVDGKVCYVPPSFPPTCGIQVFQLPGALVGSRFKWSEEDMAWTFPFYRERRRYQPARSQIPFLWESLRSKDSEHVPSIYDTAIEALYWRKSKPARYTRSKLNGTRMRRLFANVVVKGSPRYKCETGQTSQWT